VVPVSLTFYEILRQKFWKSLFLSNPCLAKRPCKGCYPVSDRMTFGLSRVSGYATRVILRSLACLNTCVWRTKTDRHILYNILAVCIVAVWFSNALVSINVVTLRRARLVPGWVTVLGRVNHLGAEPATQVTSACAIPLWVGAVSTSESWGVNRHIAWYTILYPWFFGISCLAED